MYESKDVGGRTFAATVALWIFMISNALAEGSSFYAGAILGLQPDPSAFGAVDLLALVNLLVLLTTGVLVFRWIYRASANAHVIANDLTISPGWAIGWYFVPIANLWKPFEAMKQIWLASHFGSNWAAGEATDLLNWWWGLWILDGVVSNASWRLADTLPELAAYLDLVDLCATIAVSLVLIRIMQQVRDAQKVTRHAEVFA